MRALALLALALAIAAVLACSSRGPSAPIPESIDPPTAEEGASSILTIHGRHFFLDTTVDYDDNGAGGVDATFAAFLGTSALGSVTYVDSQTLTALAPVSLAPGVHTLRIVDPAGRVGVLGSALTVSSCFRVTTAADEQNGGESPLPPHLGAGLSLREALLLANAKPGHDCIRVPALTVQPATLLPALSDSAGLVVRSDPGARIDGALLTTGTPVGLDLATSGNQLLGLELAAFNQASTPSAVQIRPGTSSNRIEGCTFLSSTRSAVVAGTSHDISASTFDGAALEIRGSDVRVEGNTIRNGGTGLQITTGSRRTVVTRNLFSNLTAGITLSQTIDNRIEHDTFDGAAGAITALGGVSGTLVRNAIATNSSLIAISGGGGSFQTLDYLVFFGNGTDCSPCTASPNIVNANPLYVSPGTGDFTPGPGSPAIDSGFDTGLDVNGAVPGLFNGTAPDRGWIETP